MSSLDRYAEEMAAGLRNSLRPDHYPQVFLESGRALVDEAASLITTNLASKRLPDGRRSYVLDAGVNLLYPSTWYRYKALNGIFADSLRWQALRPCCRNVFGPRTRS